jgi:hypothetical protein
MSSSSSQSSKMAKSAAYRDRSSMPPNKLSKVFNYFYRNIAQNLFSTSKESTYIQLLDFVEKEMNTELIISRVLSRDLFALNDTLTELFESLTEVLNRRVY